MTDALPHLRFGLRWKTLWVTECCGTLGLATGTLCTVQDRLSVLSKMRSADRVTNPWNSLPSDIG